MKAKELLLECKIKLKVSTDYKLAQGLNVDRARIADYMKGKRTPDAYVAFKIALCLNRDPASVLAEIEADTEKNEVRKTFWRDFLQRAKQATLWGTLGLIFTVALLGGVAQNVGSFRRFRNCA